MSRPRSSSGIYRLLERSPATVREHGMGLLRWFRFLWSIGIEWDRATRVEARNFCRWMLVAGKPSRRHWRRSPDGVIDAFSLPVV